MAEYLIRGGKRICGEFTPHGAKNAVLPILAASLLTGDESIIRNCPDISDVSVMVEILRSVGCETEKNGDVLTVNSRGLTCCHVPVDLMQKMRSSVFLAGALLARCGKAVISQPGGCSIGRRPIDIHIKALKKMGVRVEEENGFVVLCADMLHGANITFDYPSVGATENIMMAAAKAHGTTVIHNAAREPEIVDLQNYLVKCGSRIHGAGTSKVIIEGCQLMHGCDHNVMADRIEAGTILMAAACTGGEIRLKNFDPSLLRNCCRVLRFAGCDLKKGRDELIAAAPRRLYAVGKVRTGPHPGFPTDLQPQLTAVMAAANGETRIEETVFESRFGFAKELIKLGADIEIFHRIAIIKGNEFLKGNRIKASDLRGGAALVLAGLASGGETVVENIEFIERGYCCFHEELSKLGADIDRCI